ncbi:MAG: allophanate hydrolase, partial [Porticoccaceae bacterium]
RSPYGACRNAVRADFPAGGSSSGSALAVALGVTSFALGTDTAGSGRVPAALNRLVGLKPTRGLLSTTGVVPACRSLDCTTFFTATAREARQLLALTARRDDTDPYSRSNPQWNDGGAFGTPRPFVFGVPREQDLEFFGDVEGPGLFAAAVAALRACGGSAREINLTPFLEAARLLYQGPWVAERQAVVGDLIVRDPGAVLPVIRAVLASAPAVTGVKTFQAQYRLQALKAECDRALARLDCVLTPTIGRPVSNAELAAEPVLRNQELGYYTNFMNLLDYAAVAVPTAIMSGAATDGLPWGVTLFGRAFTDQYLLGVADALQRQLDLSLPNGRRLGFAAPTTSARHDRVRVVVCGAHLGGLPLNWQLTVRGGYLIEATKSAPNYRLYALPGGPPQRPAMVRVNPLTATGGGAAIDVEVWELPSAELGSFVAGIGAPLGLGKVQLADGRWETGFICEHGGVEGAEDITAYGGWRGYLRR